VLTFLLVSFALTVGAKPASPVKDPPAP